MIALDEEAFICDMAETYHIYDYRGVPCKTLGTLATGLREDSRIKMEINGVKAGPETLILANVYDVCRMILWAQTEDGAKGRNRPKSLADTFIVKKRVDHSHDLTPREYQIIRNRILKGKRNG